ncbi:MAG: hypothetical protein K0A98_10225 [Trueperaceae bacterium]|nr:hypothetical protein [Trueperaceae bacterium]
MRQLLMTALVAALGAALALAHAQAPAQLTLLPPDAMVQGEEATLLATLTDAAGEPLAGETLTFFATLPFFDYVSVVEIGTARTDFRGEASLAYTPTVDGARTFSVAYAGAADTAAATASQRARVAEGYLDPVSAPKPAVLSWLTRGRATALLLPAILGVWVVFGYALFQMARISNEGRQLAATASGTEAGA